MVAVGTALASDPPHRSVRALLTHTAPTLVNDSKAVFRPGMENAGGRQPSIGDFQHSVPVEAESLAASTEGFKPQPRALGPKGSQGSPIARNSMIRKIAPHNCCKPDPLINNGLMHTFTKLRLDRKKLGA